jgi:hypothetical protein
MIGPLPAGVERSITVIMCDSATSLWGIPPRAAAAGTLRYRVFARMLPLPLAAPYPGVAASV